MYFKQSCQRIGSNSFFLHTCASPRLLLVNAVDGDGDGSNGISSIQGMGSGLEGSH